MMRITHGLMAGQVLQRDERGNGDAWLHGVCEDDGDLELRILKAGKPVRGFDWGPRGTVTHGSISITLGGVKTGGPYRVELRVKQGRKVVDRVALDDILVGDVWFLAGQSNMEGVGNMDQAPKPHPMVRAFFMRDEWGMAEEKLHYLEEAVDRVHNGYGDEPGRPPKEVLQKGRTELIKGVSPGLAFGLEMYRRTGVPQGLIPCAHGGTSMAQWSPDLQDQGGASLYGAMMRRYSKLGQHPSGVLWYQGESDANPGGADLYTQKMIELVAATRRDMWEPKLPWVVVQLGCHACGDDPVSWNRIQEQQRRLPEVIKHLDVAPAIDLELDDGIHIGGRGQQVLGARLARLADKLVHKAKGVKPGIRLKEIAIVPTPSCQAGAACRSVEVSYANVAGRLESHGPAVGFVLLDAHGNDVCGIFKTTLKRNRALLHSNLSRPQLEMLSVSYGHGRHPVCTISDSEGMSIPVMQTVPIDPEHPLCCERWETTPLSGVTAVAKVSYAKANAARGWCEAPPRAGFGVLPKPADEPTTGVFVMRTTLQATDALDAEWIFGANAPFKVWLNGKSLMSDAKATVPMDDEQYKAAIRLKRGANRVLVAFDLKHPGAHFGIVARVATPQGRREPRVS